MNAVRRALVLGLLLTMVAPVVVHADTEDLYRLDDTVVPTSQQVELELDPQQTKYRGTVNIELAVGENTDGFRLHAQEMEFSRVELSRGGKSIPVEFEDVGEVDLVQFRADLEAGAYELQIEFANEFDTTSKGLYRLVSDGDAYLFTQFESDDARQAFPCWDEPRFKIPWQLTLKVPTGETAAFANTPVATETTEGNWRRIEFEPTPPMPTYLVAMAVGALEAVPIEGMSVPGNVITPRGKTELAAEAVRSTPPILAALETYFGRPYPYQKLDLVAVPEFWPGAMENVGLITYRDTILLLENEDLTIRQQRRLAYVTAHEIAHQWFGNLVTMEWWDDLWLNESFATWVGNKITSQVFPEYEMDVTEVRQTLGRAMGPDALVSARAIRQPVHSTDNIMQSADGLAYEKGSAVLGMFEAWMGEDLFREGVIHYLEQNEWGNARADQLWTALSETSGVDVGSAMSTFLDQPGVPLVTATPLGDERVELRQERFLHYGAELPEGSSPQWQIPVVLKYSDGNEVKTHRVLLSEPVQTLELTGAGELEWVHPNGGEKGYYHWDVDPAMLLQMANEAPELFLPRERTALPGHLEALVDAGRLDGATFLRANEMMARDTHPEVVSAALDGLGTVRVAFVTEDLEEPFAIYVRRTLEPVADRFGLQPRPEEDETVALLRPRLVSWLGKYGHNQDVVAFAKEMTAAALADEEVDPEVLSACLQVTAIDGDWKLYNAYKSHVEDAATPAERSMYLRAMGWFRDPQVVKASMRYALKGDLKPQEMFAIPQGVGASSQYRPLLWEWLTNNYDTIMERIPPVFGVYMPYFAAGCSADRLEAAREFFDEDGDHYVTGQEKELAKVEESVLNCVGLREREGPAVTQYLNEQVSLSQ